jgi:hypothetical protein
MYCCKRALKLSYPSEFKLVLIRYDVFLLMTYLFVLSFLFFLGKLNNYSNSIRCLTVSQTFESRGCS